MSRIHEGLEDTGFTQPSGIVTAQVCSKSGKLAIEGVCDSDPRGSMVYTEYFAEGTVPTEYCDHHIGATICNDSHQIATAYCPSTTSSVFIVGGSASTQDGPYLLTDDILNGTCTLHTAPDVTTPVTPVTPSDTTDTGTSTSQTINGSTGTTSNSSDNKTSDDDSDDDSDDSDSGDDSGGSSNGSGTSGSH